MHLHSVMHLTPNCVILCCENGFSRMELWILIDLFAPYGLQGSNTPWFVCWLCCYMHCLFVCLLNFLPFFLPYFFLSLCFLPDLFTSLLVYFLTYLSTPPRIDPLWMHVCSRCVRFSLSVLRLARKNISEITYFVSGGT